MTVTPWYDNTGGFPKQLALCNSDILFRTGKSNDAWKSWQKLNP